MSDDRQLANRVKSQRLRRNWSQMELGRRAGISRAAVSAIEIQRLVPSVAAALALAAALECRVEDLFGPGPSEPTEPEWAWTPSQEPCRLWFARAGGKNRYYPAEATAAGLIPHDGVMQAATVNWCAPAAPDDSLVMACCDPAAALLASAYRQASGFRLIPLQRSSRQALDALAEGLVDAAGVHFASDHAPDANLNAVRARLGPGYSLLRMARWQEGLAVSSHLRPVSVRSVLRSKLRWVGREEGSGARQCLEGLLAGRPLPRKLAKDHRGVAEAIRCDWADAGVCHRLASDEAGLRFFSLRDEAYDLVFPTALERDPRIQALIGVVRAPGFRGMLGQLPGYDCSSAGEVGAVK